MFDFVIRTGSSRPIFQGQPDEVKAWLEAHKHGLPLTGYWVFCEKTREYLDITSYLHGVRRRIEHALPLKRLYGRWVWAYNIAFCKEFRVLRMLASDVFMLAELVGGINGLEIDDYLVRISENEVRVLKKREFDAEYLFFPESVLEKADGK